MRLDRLHFSGIRPCASPKVELITRRPSSPTPARRRRGRQRGVGSGSVEIETEPPSAHASTSTQLRRRSRAAARQAAGPAEARNAHARPGNVTDRILGRSWSESQLGTFFDIDRVGPARGARIRRRPKCRGRADPIFGGLHLPRRVGFFGNSAPFSQAVPPNRSLHRDDLPERLGYRATTAGDTRGRTPSHRRPRWGATARLTSSRPVPKLSRERLGRDRGPVARPRRTASRRRLPRGSPIGFAITARVTGMNLVAPDGGAPDKSKAFTLPGPTAHVRSERLELVELPIEDPVGATRHDDRARPGRLVLGLVIGQPIASHGASATTFPARSFTKSP